MRQWKYVLNSLGEPVPCSDVLLWGAWFEQANRAIAQEHVGPVAISTIFLGLDHGFDDDAPPILFESMIFGGPLSGSQQRYASRAEAIVGHRELVESAREAHVTWDSLFWWWRWIRAQEEYGLRESVVERFLPAVYAPLVWLRSLFSRWRRRADVEDDPEATLDEFLAQ